MRRDELSPKTCLHCCEDQFNKSKSTQLLIKLLFFRYIKLIASHKYILRLCMYYSVALRNYLFEN